MLLVWSGGLYLLSRHGDGGEIRWTSPWIVTSLAIVIVMSAIGPAGERRRVAQLHKTANAAPDGPVTAELDALRRDPVLVHVLCFGSCQIVVLLFLMTNKPGLVATISVAIGAAMVSVILARFALSRCCRSLTWAAPLLAPQRSVRRPPATRQGQTTAGIGTDNTRTPCYGHSD